MIRRDSDNNSSIETIYLQYEVFKYCHTCDSVTVYLYN